jgi:hypothetical protein
MRVHKLLEGANLPGHLGHDDGIYMDYLGGIWHMDAYGAFLKWGYPNSWMVYNGKFY